ncbi:ATP synthase subunit d, mitochondrial-like [Ostrinia nubilalis]|uniref:ATP synthase subunit d, mitochondrial-like n=1 Tax=Ostrinia nubilalis TaxID=29057 RepID=UPI003082387A
MAKRFTKSSINWAELEKKVPPEQRVQYFAFKAKSDAYLRRVLAHPPEPPKIDWAAYSKMVPVPGLVDKLKTEYEKFQVPYPQDTLSAKVDEQWKALEPEIKKFCAEMQVDIDKATKELSRIRALPKFEEMTMEMYAEMFPDLAIDPVNRPTYWPHTPEEQVGYKPPEQKVEKKKAP